MSTNIKTWQERMQEVYGQDTRGFKPDSYMLAEIAELRATLEEFTPPTPIEGQSDLSKGVLHAIYRACQRGDSPERMHAAIMALMPDAATQAPSAPVAPIDERAEFQRAMNAARFFPRELDFSMTKSPSGKRDEYVNTHLESSWNGWQARAALSVQAGSRKDDD